MLTSLSVLKHKGDTQRNEGTCVSSAFCVCASNNLHQETFGKSELNQFSTCTVFVRVL